jgi:Mlc titration factor MtfA (ptsG expression regulator)
MFGFKKRRRRRIRRRPFPAAWLEILRRNVPYYDRLTSEQQEELRGDIQVFVAEKNFEGCGGVTMTDEIRVTIAAYASILLLGRPHEFYPRLQSILVYPDTYRAPSVRRGPMNTVTEQVETRLGESWQTGAVVVAWNPMRHRASDPDPAHNVVLHEFAHQLDQENGRVDGAPLLSHGSRYVVWARILTAEYEALVADAQAGRPTVLDKYGATAPAEFFAVATECFFEKPHLLQTGHPELYDELRRFYRQDPVGGD